MDRAADRLARSLELEKAYVHDTYQEMYNSMHKSKPWPKVTQFLHDLEPGSLVCDIGCGTGKYLSTNPHVFKVGVDRCLRLTEIARSQESEVLVCDNLTLPFKDCSLDAVLSIAVIHHFSTTERRVCALRELARVLRIGGRIIITVWAMERRHRKFESQDVLMPWHKPCRNLDSESTEFSTTTTTSDEEYFSTRKKSNSDSITSSKICCEKRIRRKEQSYGRKGIVSSPSSSSLSSPANETCYSFVRKAIQKLAGSTKRGKVTAKPWFSTSWATLSGSELPSVLRSDPEGCEACNEDVQNVPIELRRMEDSPDLIPLFNRTTTHKSKSLSDIKMTTEKRMVRSRSSIPELEKSMPLTVSKPKLVKQKASLCDEDAEEDRDKATDMKDLVNKLPQFDVGSGSRRYKYRSNEIQQRSMNEELMSVERLKEKEIMQKNIQRQASLNEELMYKTRTLESIKDTLQLLKSGFTKTFKNPSSQVSDNIKSGISRMLGYKETIEEKMNDEKKIELPVPALVTTSCCDGRRSSREDGSSEDSSKDSLQSDASMDSEDSLSSLASVIFVNASGGSDKICSPPLVEQQARTAPCTPTAKSQSQYRSSSHPNTPKTAPIQPSHFKLPARFNSQNGNEPHQLNLSTEQAVEDILKPIKLSPVKTAIEMKLKREQEKDQEQERRDVCEGGDQNIRPKEKISAERLKQIQDLLLSTKPVNGRNRLPKADRNFSGLRGRHFIKTVEETFHPEIDDIDSDFESSSSDSVGSVISVVVDDERRTTDAEFEDPTDTEIPLEPEKEILVKCSISEQIFPMDSTVVTLRSVKSKDYVISKGNIVPKINSITKIDKIHKEGAISEHDCNPKEFVISKGYIHSKTDSMGIGDNISKESIICEGDCISKEDNNGELENKAKENIISKIHIASKTDSISKEDNIPKESIISEEDNISNKDISKKSVTSEEDNISKGDIIVISEGHSISKEDNIIIDDVISKKNIVSRQDSVAKEDFNSKADDILKEHSISKEDGTFQEDSVSKSDSTHKVDIISKEVITPKVDVIPKEVITSEVDIIPKKVNTPKMDIISKGDTIPKEFNIPKVNIITKEDVISKEDLSSKEDQPSHTNRWSLQEHPNKGTQVRNSHSLGSIPKHKRTSKCSKDELSDLPETWDEECQKHLVDFAERLNKELRAAIAMDSEGNHKKTRDELVDSPEKVELMQYFHKYMGKDDVLEPSSSDGHMEDEPLDYHRIEILAGSEVPRRPSISIETQDSVDKVLRSREGFRSRHYRMSIDSAEDRHASLELECDSRRDTVSSSQASLLRPGNSLESNDTVDTHTTTQSTTSLTSWSDCSKDTRFADRRQARCDGRSSSEETNPRRAAVLVRQHAAVETQDMLKSDDTSLSTSQESLSENGGGAITFHRYYHVFREGELDQLIEKHADNLHIISSYYDQSNWCVIAEKVQVWTI